MLLFFADDSLFYRLLLFEHSSYARTGPYWHCECSQGYLFRKQGKALLTERADSVKFAFYISRITGMISGLRLVLFWIYRFRSILIFSLITP